MTLICNLIMCYTDFTEHQIGLCDKTILFSLITGLVNLYTFCVGAPQANSGVHKYRLILKNIP